MDSIFQDGIEYRVYDHIYAVSREGKFLRFGEPFDRFGRPASGYPTVGKRLAHRVVATCWCERPEGANHVHHKNHDKADFRADNLEWLTQRDHLLERHRETLGRQPMSEQGKQKLREYRLGRTTAEATKHKQREAAVRLGCKPPPRPVGTKMDAAFRARCSELSPKPKRPCVVDGVRYGSFKEAGLARGEKLHSLRKRCLSPNFPNYQLGSI